MSTISKGSFIEQLELQKHPLSANQVQEVCFIAHKSGLRNFKGLFSLGNEAIAIKTNLASGVAKFIERNGEGVMLISFNVDNTRKAVEELKAKDYPFIPDSRGEVARPFRDCEFAFVHPKKLNGVLTELIDYKWEELEK